jgi:inner membrane protein YhjD
MVQAVQRIGSQAKLRLERARARFGFVDVVVRTFKRYSADDCGFYAASLTYYAFFSIFPLLLFSAAVLGYITFLSPNLREDILNAGLDAFPLLDSVLSPSTLDTIQEQRGSLALIAAVLALYSGSGGIVALQHAMNRISGVTEEPAFVPKRLRSLGWLGLLGVSALVSVGLGAVASFAGGLFGDVGLANEMTALIGHLVGFAVGVWIFLSAFKYLPKPTRSWREVLPGALLAAAAFEVLKLAGTWYLERGAATREATFGAFAAAAGLLVVAYLLAQVTLLSFELNQVLGERRRLRQSTSEPEGGTGG